MRASSTFLLTILILPHGCHLLVTNKVQKLQRACLVKPVKVEVASKYSTVDTLRQQYLFVPAKFKDCYLTFVLNELSGSTSMVGVEALIHGPD